MQPENKVSNSKELSRFSSFINTVEKIGNKLPHPFWLFVYLSGIVLFLSFILSKAGVSVTYLSASRDAAEAPVETTITVQNLLSKEALQVFFQDFTTNYTGFAPLGLVMIMMLGVGLLEQTGMLSALIRRTILGAPVSLIVAIVAIVGVNANLASDAGVIIVPALAGAIFKSLGKNPWIGVIVGYVAANGGFSASVFIAGTDVLLAGITQSVTTGLNIDAAVHPLMNWYFMSASVIVIVGGTVLVTELFTKKYLSDPVTVDNTALQQHQLTDNEKKGLRWSGITALVFIAIMLLLTIPENALFRADDGSLLPRSPLLSSIVAILFIMFFLLAISYGKASGTIKALKDVPELMQKGVSGALGFIVIALPASIFINLLNASNITTVIGVYGADYLQSINMTGFPLFIIFILIVTIMNLFMTSGSAKWLIIAPIFIPMFSILGYSPAMTQAAYRIADMSTNIISPIDYYVPVIMGLLATFNTDKNKEVGIGTVISLCLPYSIAFLIGMIGLLFVWYLFGLPLGPGAPMFM